MRRALAGDLKARGLIQYTRGNIEVIDRDGLEAAAFECYGGVLRRYVGLRVKPPTA